MCTNWLYDCFVVWLRGRLYSTEEREQPERLLEESRTEKVVD